MEIDFESQKIAQKIKLFSLCWYFQLEMIWRVLHVRCRMIIMGWLSYARMCFYIRMEMALHFPTTVVNSYIGYTAIRVL